MSCPPDKILNPATGRCVKRSGRIGKRLVDGQAASSSRPNSPRRNRCRPDQIINPATGRCVKKTSRIGKRLVDGQAAPSSRPNSPTRPRRCKPDQVLNPATGRCVKKTSRIGKRLVGRGSGGSSGPMTDEEALQQGKIRNPQTGRFIDALSMKIIRYARRLLRRNPDDPFLNDLRRAPKQLQID